MKAFPCEWSEYDPSYECMVGDTINGFEKVKGNFRKHSSTGMDLRDYLAAKVMPAMIANFLSKELDELDPMGWMDGLATDAYTMADAMMKARKL